MNNNSSNSLCSTSASATRLRFGGIGAKTIMKLERHHPTNSPSITDPDGRKLYKLPEWLWQAVVDGFPSKAAILDQSGIILYVNDAWRSYANEERLDSQNFGEGMNYLDFCRLMFSEHSAVAEAIATRLRQVMLKERGEISLEFACPTPSKDQWCEVNLIRLDPPETSDPFKVLVLQQEITIRI